MRVEHTLHIEAPLAAVWAVTEDVERWPSWTPTMHSVQRMDEGTFDVGSSAAIRQPGMPETVWTVIEMDRGRSFTWEGRARGMRMRATHELSAEGAGTKNTLRVEVAGVVAFLLWPLVRPALRRALRQENAGLKSFCERAR
jgi:carbon monoxide dehydrogenase subunit G